MLKDTTTGKSEGYELVGPGEEDYDAEIMKILMSGPLGQAITNKKVGDMVELSTPRGNRRLEVTKVD